MQDFTHLYNTHYLSIYKLIYNLVGNAHESADITQDVFLALYTQLEKGIEVSYPKTWLYRVGVNKSLNFIQRRKEVASLNEAVFGIEADKLVFPDLKDTEEKSKILKNAMEKLKPNEKTIVLLYSEGLSYKEMAEICEIPFNSVGKLISRTLEKLRLILKNRKDELFDE